MNTEQERAEFKAWHAEKYWAPLFDDELGRFIPTVVQNRWEAYQAGRAALQSQDRADAERLDWMLRKLPGDAIRYCVGVLDDTADAEEFRAAIDHARRIEGEGE